MAAGLYDIPVNSIDGKQASLADHKGEVMVQPRPGASFVVVEAEDAFALLVVALDAPAKAAQRHQRHDVRVGRKVG